PQKNNILADVVFFVEVGGCATPPCVTHPQPPSCEGACRFAPLSTTKAALLPLFVFVEVGERLLGVVRGNREYREFRDCCLLLSLNSLNSLNSLSSLCSVIGNLTVVKAQTGLRVVKGY
ncbi:MAG: hypothetical protein IKB90_08770, partial [Alistipes sp.]|nr:hypothetical protein [Alistipes sp.]